MFDCTLIASPASRTTFASPPIGASVEPAGISIECTKLIWFDVLESRNWAVAFISAPATLHKYNPMIVVVVLEGQVYTVVKLVPTSFADAVLNADAIILS